MVTRKLIEYIQTNAELLISGDLPMTKHSCERKPSISKLKVLLFKKSLKIPLLKKDDAKTD